jgi:hypothetical protein
MLENHKTIAQIVKITKQNLNAKSIFRNPITVTNGATTLNGTLYISASTTLNDTLHVTGDTTLSGATTLNNNLYVTGTSNLLGATTLDNFLYTSGATTLNDTLYVSGAATFKNNPYVISPSAILDNKQLTTKRYVDLRTSGIKIRKNVQIAIAENIDLSSSYSTIDGYTLNNGDRVLLKNQNDKTENGVYTYNMNDQNFTRSLDMDYGQNVGGFVFLCE